MTCPDHGAYKREGEPPCPECGCDSREAKDAGCGYSSDCECGTCGAAYLCDGAC